MGGAVRLRQDFGADELRRSAVKAKDGAQARRLLAMAAVHDGLSLDPFNRSKINYLTPPQILALYQAIVSMSTVK
jgi:hypothetical protein